MSIRKWAAALCVAAAMGPAFAAGPIEIKKNLKIALAPDAGAYASVASRAAAAAAKELGVRALWTGKVGAAGQVAFIKRAVANGCAAIVISPADSEEVASALKAAKEAGVAVITWDSDTDPEARSFCLSRGTNEQLGGFLVDMAANQLKGKRTPPIKRVAFLYASPENVEQNEWVAAAKAKILRELPSWNIAATQYGYGEPEASLDTATALLNAYPNLDALICPDTTALLAAAKAADKLKRSEKLAIVGFARPSAARKYLESGAIKEIGLWDVATQARIAVYLAAQLGSGAAFKVGESIEIPDTGKVSISPNSFLGKKKEGPNSGVLCPPERLVFTVDNIDEAAE